MEGRIEGLEKTMDKVQEEIDPIKDTDAISNNRRGDEFREVQPQYSDETRPTRLELPLFSSDNPYGWLNREESYFHFNGIDDKDKLEVVAVCLEAILQRFTPSQLENLYEVLIGLQQTGSMAQYKEEFELLSAPLKDADDAVLMGIFINGPRGEIKAELHLSKLGNLTQIMDQSQRIKEKNWALSQAHLPRLMPMPLPRGSTYFPMTENRRTRSATSPMCV
ncbi:hypothetical protein KY290_021051 [Solanum tuberosum]|uniref:Retrotransposon gag domain-containing protein n=1 Tax=Solanum tuberosum TaxID=4113 RepID=A0ABQ7V1F7_SOLTU|nr:hypothetical protein KY290_021051 [Solanum tuberosum]